MLSKSEQERMDREGVEAIRAELDKFKPLVERVEKHLEEVRAKERKENDAVRKLQRLKRPSKISYTECDPYLFEDLRGY